MISQLWTGYQLVRGQHENGGLLLSSHANWRRVILVRVELTAYSCAHHEKSPAVRAVFYAAAGFESVKGFAALHLYRNHFLPELFKPPFASFDLQAVFRCQSIRQHGKLIIHLQAQYWNAVFNPPGLDGG